MGPEPWGQGTGPASLVWGRLPCGLGGRRQGAAPGVGRPRGDLTGTWGVGLVNRGPGSPRAQKLWAKKGQKVGVAQGP